MCIEALGKLADPAAVPALAAAARHRWAWIRSEALLALSKIDHPAVAQIALAASEDFDPAVRDRAVRILAARGGTEATARLLMFCDGPLAPVALRGLIRIGDERAVPSLIRVLLAAGDRRTRHLAGRAVARSARRAPWLYPSTEKTPAQIRAIAWVFGEIGDQASCQRLSSLLSHRDEFVRARAAAALGKIAVPDTADSLRAALADISPHVRAAAATALGRLAVKRAVPWLKPARHDPYPAVRAAAQAAIRTLRQAKQA
jgi:HEAT repeat protein